MKRIVSAAMIVAALIIASCAANGTVEKPSATGTVTEGAETDESVCCQLEN